MEKDSTIVCFGDSLTAGYGAEESEAYPARLQASIAIPVINAGTSGITTSGAANRIDEVLSYNPVIIIIELGANDFFSSASAGHLDMENLAGNFRTILSAFRKSGRKIYLAKFYTPEIVSGLPENARNAAAGFDAMFSTLAQEFDAELINDIWGEVWGNSDMMYDRIHPNATGYEKMADRYFLALEPVLSANNLIAGR